MIDDMHPYRAGIPVTPRLRTQRWAATLGAALMLTLAVAAAPRPSHAGPDRLEGILYRPHSGRTVVLYRWELTRDSAGIWRSKYVAPDGTVAAEDELTWDAGQPVRYSYVRHATGEASSVERLGSRLVYVHTRAGSQERAEEALPVPFAVGPSLAALAQDHWQELWSGKHVRVHYGVLDQLRSYAFDLLRVADAAQDPSGGSVVVRMQPASVLLRWFVDPVDLVFSSGGAALMEIRGRALPVVWKNGSAQPVDAHLVITQPHPFSR